MCNIWQKKNPKDLALEYIDKLKNLKYINLSGGEPFLNKDLVLIVEKLKKNNPQAQIIISTNAYASDLILRITKEIIKIDSQIGIRVSIDGIGEIHNKIRGLKDAYQKAIGTIKGLQKIGINNLGLAFTLMPSNTKELRKVYQLAQDLGLEFSIASVQNSEIYFNKSNNKLEFNSQIESDLNYIIRRELSSDNLKKYLRAYFIFGLQHYLKTKQRLIPADAGQYSIFIDVLGNIYPSNLINYKIGNLKNTKLENLYYQSEFKDGHWSICTIRGSMKKYWYKVVFWILINKLKLIFKLK